MKKTSKDISTDKEKDHKIEIIEDQEEIEVEIEVREVDQEIISEVRNLIIKTNKVKIEIIKENNMVRREEDHKEKSQNLKNDLTLLFYFNYSYHKRSIN